VWEGNPWPPKYRVGAFSHYHEIFRTARVPRASSPWSFRRRTADLKFTYHFRGSESSLRDYVSRNPVTGLLIAKDEEILFEHYQYGRNDHHQMMSQSIAKSITGLLVGLAVADGVIKSVDDTAGVYVPGLRGSEYGNTPIRDLLHMSSGADFGEERDSGRDLDRLWIDMVLRRWPFNKGTVESIRQFNNRVAPPGTRFYYASIETDVLGLVVHHAVGKSLSDYIFERIWSQIGAEADAAWLVDADGFEVAHGFFNAVLRDYARLARLLAHGRVGGQADHTLAMDDRRDNGPAVRFTSCARKGHLRFRLRLPGLVAAGRATPVRFARLQRTAHLHRSNLEGDDGPHRAGGR
jgi:CubicO group peptidase (beta-lactamase class C family)